MDCRSIHVGSSSNEGPLHTIRCGRSIIWNLHGPRFLKTTHVVVLLVEMAVIMGVVNSIVLLIGMELAGLVVQSKVSSQRHSCPHEQRHVDDIRTRSELAKFQHVPPVCLVLLNGRSLPIFGKVAQFSV